MTPTEWLLSGDTGVSSKTILAVMTGSSITDSFGGDVPYDAGDFGRCYRLLLRFPEWRARLNEVAETYPMWGPMVAAWDELSQMYEHGLASKQKNRFEAMYQRMRSLVDEGRRAAGLIEYAPGCWRRGGASIQRGEV